jgi:hypothetical protein
MAKEVEFDVKREHLGDKPYKAGDTRTMREADAANLVGLGVLAPKGTKAEPAPKNKMEPAPANKAGTKAKA